ncbi:hypothetical protein IWQ60_003786 [Tieghemiomyces parasiticus]|uniref:Uncharacterized protein n=1 Tax=Tieghemiomyces parasiticus TaxID=78921 RepID=A0A9W8DUH0_9FUNG|nr:hypothetical protein IWQ60_003786 [Tieghemiomyces parasiticus]
MSAVVREIYRKHGTPPVAKIFTGHPLLAQMLNVFKGRGVGREVIPAAWVGTARNDCYVVVSKVEVAKGLNSGRVWGTQYWHGKPASKSNHRIRTGSMTWTVRDLPRPKCLP